MIPDYQSNEVQSNAAYQCSAKNYCLMMMIISISDNVYQFHHSDPPIFKDLVKSLDI